MSLWDHIKPGHKPPVATDVDMRADERAIQLNWDDGKTTRVSARTLRQHCPCAECVDEFTGKRTLNQDSIPAQLSFMEMGKVGNYALSFTFSDQHRMGIYTWSLLRSLSEAWPEK
jgi:DUF971 family protein